MNRDMWNPGTWHDFPAAQQPAYEDPELLSLVLKEVALSEPLVTMNEIGRLEHSLSLAAQGKNFIIHGGDCAERFVDCTAGYAAGRIKLLRRMASFLETKGLPVICIGRIAGQYAKPRTFSTEVVNGCELPVYRGDGVNSFEPTASGRRPDPARLGTACSVAGKLMSFIREYLSSSEGTDFFISHEGLILAYEEAMTRKDSSSGRYYNGGAHTLWIGERTRELKGAHVEYFRGLANPVAVKIGPSAEPEELTELCSVLNPENISGRLTFIIRLGMDRIEERLPSLVRAVRSAGRNVLWSCDPMHGNIIRTASGFKTCSFESVEAEIRTAFRILTEEGSLLSGVHFEMTDENVTECTGGPSGSGEEDLSENYQSFCDPRLNCRQSLEAAAVLSRILFNEPVQ